MVWHGGHVSRAARELLLGQQARTLWFTGLTASGKSTLAFSLERALPDQGWACFMLDGDNVRHGLNGNLGFSPADRSENIRRVAEVAKLMNDAGLIVISAFIAPFRADRAMARNIIGEDRVIEIHISTDLAICEYRDSKRMYQRARAGQSRDFTGVSSPYEIPECPDFMLDTGVLTVSESMVLLGSLLKLELRR